MSAGVQTTAPLALGFLLETGPLLLVSEQFACPITMQGATLIGSASSADVGVSWPLVLGLTTGTEGVTNYTLSSEQFACPVTLQDAALDLETPADVGVSWPLALGLLLGASGDFTLVSEAFSCPIAIADSVSTEFEENAEEQRRGGVSRFVMARKRLALQTWVDYLTEEEPAESTKRVIAEVKAGRPIPEVKPPKGPDSISAEKLADKIIPSRLWAAQNLIVDNVDLQKVVANALRIAQEREDEDILLLL